MQNSHMKIDSQEKLDLVLKAANEPLAFFVALNFGLRSSKDISLTEDGDYYVYHYIDSSEEVIPHNKLMKDFIGEAITKGALYLY